MDSTDKLDRLFAMQAAFQHELGYSIADLGKKERSAFIIEYAVHTEHELHEMLQELPYFKSWKKYDVADYEASIGKARGEFVDVLHFFLNVAMALGFTPDTLYRAFLDKHDINHARQRDTAHYKKCFEAVDPDAS